MKILYLVTQAEEAGAQKYVLLLAKRFGGIVAAGTDSDWLFQQCRENGIEARKLRFLIRNINPFYDLAALLQIFFLIRKEKPDLVHANSSKAGMLGSIAAKAAGVKTIFTSHGFTFHQPGLPIGKGIFALLEKFALRFRDYTITVSEKDLSTALASGFAKPGQASCVHNGLPIVEFLDRQTAASDLRLEPGKTQAATIANLYYRKGLDVLIEAVEKLNNDNVRFTIIGEGPERASLEKLINEKKLSSKIRLIGAMPDAARYLKAFDIFVLPSRNEALPYVLIEALQAGLPIVATDTAGNAEVAGQAGIIVPPENPARLAEAIGRALTEESKQKLAAKTNAQAARFTIEECLGETEKIYRAVGMGVKSS